MDVPTVYRRRFAAAAWPVAAVAWIVAAFACGTAVAQRPGWNIVDSPPEAYATTEALFMQRDNQAVTRPLVINGDTLATAIGTPDLQFPVAPGVRSLYGQRGPQGFGWELGYMGIYGMFADAQARGDSNLEIAPPLSGAVASLWGNSYARATWSATLNSAEANVFLHEHLVHVPRRSAYALEAHRGAFAIDWLAGFRWAGLDEQAAILMANPATNVSSSYAVRTGANLFGGQIGARTRIDHDRWTLESTIKAAVAGSFAFQAQDPIVDAITGDVYRSARSAQTTTTGGIFDVNTALVYRLSDTWGIRLGYNMLWLTGVPLAPNQFDFETNTQAGTAIDAKSTVWLNGGSLGLEGRW